jgi:hypothetical protein
MATEIPAANVLLCLKSLAACVGKMDTELPALTTFGDLETQSLLKFRTPATAALF